jgi:hypothetical protein
MFVNQYFAIQKGKTCVTQSPMKLFLFAITFLFAPLSVAGQSGCDHDPSDHFVICEEKEVVPTPSVSDLIIFPNPTTDFFEVKNAKNTEGVLLDMCGRFIRQINLTTIVDVSDLPKGLYIIYFDFKVHKLIIQ